MSNTPLRVGIAGYGVVGKRRHEHMDLNPNFITVAVCDQKFSKSNSPALKIPCYASYQELLDQEDIDVFFVCLTNDVAANATIQALGKNLHVFCEKPPGKDLADILKVIEVEKNKPALKLKYGFNHRYHKSVQETLRIIHSGELGEIINLRGVYGKSAIINFESDWRTKREIAGGGILLDQGIHMLDLLRLFAGEFSQVMSIVKNSYWNHDVEDNAYALMQTDDGKVAILHSSATQWRHRFSLEIALEQGALVLTGILSGSKSYGDETLTIINRSSPGTNIQNEKTTSYDHDPSWADEIAEFADSIINDKPILFGSSDDAFKSMVLVSRIYSADPTWRDQWNLPDV
jgi:predicted dehydrogenase